MTEVGKIPEDWDNVTIDRVIEFIGGSQPAKGTFRFFPKKGYVRLLQIRDYKTDKYSTYIPEELAKRNCSREDIMIGRYGPPIFQILRGLEGSYNVALIKAVPREGYDREFVFHFLKQDSLFRFVENLSQRTSGQTGVDLHQLRGYSCIIPSTLKEQQAIATVLSDTDALIRALESLITKKQQVRQGVMQELLNGTRRLIGFDEQWIMVTLGQLGKFRKGKGIRRDQVLSSGVPCVRYGELYTQYENVISQINSFISFDVAKDAQRISYGDILFAGSGETKEEIGKCAALLLTDEVYAGGDIVILTPGNNTDPVFLAYLLNTPQVQSKKSAKGQGDAVVHISASSLIELELFIPPSLEEQRALASILNAMEDEITHLEFKLQKTKFLKQALMQQLLTGKIRLV